MNLSLMRDNYYDDAYYWSASFVKEMLDCPARAIAELNGEHRREPSTALLVGSYVDAYFDGKQEFERFFADHPEIINSRTGELKKDYVQADTMIKRAEQDSTFMSYLQGQRQKIFTGEIDEIPFKCKMDFYLPGERIVDLKTIKDLEPIYQREQGRISPIEAWNWDLQLAIYAELEGNDLPTYLAIITKQDPADLFLVEVEKHRRDACMEILKEKLPLFDAMRQGIVEPERCGKCAYCRSTHKITEPISLDELVEY